MFQERNSKDWDQFNREYETFILVDDLSSLEHTAQNVRLYIDSLVFIHVRELNATYEVYRKPRSKTSFVGEAVKKEICKLRSKDECCEPMDSMWPRRSDLTGVHLKGE